MRDRSRCILGAVLVGTVLNPLDGSMIAVALPAVQRGLGASAAASAWLITIFYLGSSVAQPVLGRLADLLGPKRVFVCGLLLVAAACTAALFAPGVGWLVGLRFLQAVGSAAAFPAGLAIVRTSLRADPGRAQQAVGTVTWVNSLSAVVGPLLGGVTVSALGWRGPFAFVAAFAAVGAAVAARALPADGRTTPERVSWRGLDALGGLLLMAVLAAAQLAIVGTAQRYGWLAVVAVGLVLLVVRERRARDPFLRLELVAGRRAAIFLQYALANLSFFTVLVLLPSWLQTGYGLSALASGYVAFPVAAVGVASNLLLARFVYRGHGQRVLLALAATSLLGAVLLTQAGPTTAAWLVALVGVLVASPNNLTTLTLQDALYRRTDAAATGAASGLFQTFRYLGAALGSTLVGVHLTTTGGAAFFDGVRTVALVILGVTAGALVLAALLRPARA